LISYLNATFSHTIIHRISTYLLSTQVRADCGFVSRAFPVGSNEDELSWSDLNKIRLL
jgi:hypothetical protein